MTEELRALIIGTKAPEHQAFYERYMRVDADKFCHLLHVEQNRYREETEPLVMDWEAEKSPLA